MERWEMKGKGRRRKVKKQKKRYPKKGEARSRGRKEKKEEVEKHREGGEEEREGGEEERGRRRKGKLNQRQNPTLAFPFVVLRSVMLTNLSQPHRPNPNHHMTWGCAASFLRVEMYNQQHLGWGRVGYHMAPLFLFSPSPPSPLFFSKSLSETF